MDSSISPELAVDIPGAPRTSRVPVILPVDLVLHWSADQQSISSASTASLHGTSIECAALKEDIRIGKENHAYHAAQASQKVNPSLQETVYLAIIARFAPGSDRDCWLAWLDACFEAVTSRGSSRQRIEGSIRRGVIHFVISCCSKCAISDGIDLIGLVQGPV